jgi:hypothetical protein
MAGSVAVTRLDPGRRGIVRIKATLTTDASGNVTAAVCGTAFGRLVGVIYKQGTLDASADITVTGDAGATVLATTTGFGGVATKYFRPTTVLAANTGTAITAAATAPNVNKDMFLAGKMKVAVANGGNAGVGTISFIVDERKGPHSG